MGSDDTRGEPAARAARWGQSLQEYLRSQPIALAQRPSPEQLWERVQHRVRVTGTRLPAEAILAERDRDRR